MLLTLRFLPVVREHSCIPPIVLRDFVDDNVDVFRFLSKDIDQRIGHIVDEL